MRRYYQLSQTSLTRVGWWCWWDLTPAPGGGLGACKWRVEPDTKVVLCSVFPHDIESAVSYIVVTA